MNDQWRRNRRAVFREIVRAARDAAPLPTMEKIGDACGLQASAIHRHLHAMVRDRWIVLHRQHGGYIAELPSGRRTAPRRIAAAA